MKRQLRIVMGDVVHESYGALSPSTVPYNVARIAAYALAMYPDALDIVIVKDVRALTRALETQPPDVVALSHYFWNAKLSAELVRWIKGRWPKAIVVQGGPNLNREERAYRAYARNNPALDFHVVSEGEVAFAALVGRVLEHGTDREALKRSSVPGCFAVADEGRTIILGPPLGRIPLTEMPSPYLTGLLDSFLDAGLEPIVEFTRGCPYSCAFCEQGSEAFLKLHWVGAERAVAEVEYIRRRVQTDTLIVADVNFGILPRDIELARFLKESQRTTGYPKQVYVYTAKNPNARTLEVIETLWPLTPFYASFQSADPQVLENIHRSNIGYDKYLAITTWAKSQGIPIGTELIFGLPGETFASFTDGVSKLMHLNSDYLSIYNLRLFPGTELNTMESRALYDARTMFRPMDTNFGEYDLGGPVRVMECEEIVTESISFTFEEFLRARAIGFLTEFLWNTGYLRPLLAYLQVRGVPPLEIFTDILDRAPGAPPAVAALFRDYATDVRAELFESEATLEASVIRDDERWRQILAGDRFLKVNLAYIGKVLLFGVEGLDEWISREAVEPRLAKLDFSPREREAVDELRRYTRLLRVPATGAPSSSERFTFDILSWIRDAYAGDLEARLEPLGIAYHFRSPDPLTFANFRQQYNARNGGWSQKHVGERFMMEIQQSRALRNVERVGSGPETPTVVVKRDWADPRQSHGVRGTESSGQGGTGVG